MKKDLPIYKVTLGDSEDQGVSFISLVSEPAIGVDWIKLSKNTEIKFKADREKQLLYGPFLIPNMLIYRNDVQNGEYYVKFETDEIEKIASKFNEDLNSRNINFEHTDEKVEAFVSENWIIEGDQDKSRSLGFDLPEGTWFGAVKVKDEEFWKERVKSDEVKGFSVEILADLEIALKNNKQKMEDLKLKRKFIAKEKFDEAVEVSSGEMIVIADEISVGQECVVVMDDLQVAESWTGEVYIGDETIKIEGGQIAEIIGGASDEGDLSSDLETDENLETDEGGNVTLTSEEVSQMIDARFAELMDEITKLKTLLDNQTEEFNKTIDEKFKTTPAVESVKKSNVDEKFKSVEERVKAFAKNR